MLVGGSIAKATSQPNRRIIAATERSAVSIPHADLFGATGTLKFLGDALDRSLVQISQGADQLQLRIGGVIGRLPITENLALDISPKFPISNLARLLSGSDQSLNRRVGADRLYDFTAWNGYLPELLLRSFALELKTSDAEGTHRSYHRVTRIDVPRPKLNFRRSEQQFWARGIPTRAVIEAFDFSRDNAVNRVLKAALRCALPLAVGEKSLASEAVEFATMLRGLDRVGSVAIANIDAECEQAIRELPRFKPGHAKAIVIARELIKRASPVLEFADRRMSLPSFLINLDDVFESYVRNSLLAASRNFQEPLRVGNGNQKDFSKALLNDNARFKIMPDVLIYRGHADLPELVADVKYKTKPMEEDRYQVIAHSLSYQSKTALLIYPKRNGGPTGLVRLGEVGPPTFPIQLYEYHFDLGADLGEEEESLGSRVLSLFEK
jgi:5-methylcytosine-specific restriction enzyme subunit McrC